MAEFTVDDRDILCAEPAADARVQVRVDYDDAMMFVADYLGMRRGEPYIVSAPLGVAPGELVDLEVSVAGAPLTLHGEVLSRWPLEGGDHAQVSVITGRFTDRLVRMAVSGLRKLPLLNKLL
jgi:hypothetical protein